MSEQTLDLTNGTLLPGIATIYGGHGPSSPSIYDPISGRFYVATIYSLTLAVVNASTDIDLENIPLNFSVGGLAVDPIDDAIFATNEGGSSVAVVNASTLTVSSTIAVGASPESVVWDPVAAEMVVVNSLSNSTTWIDGRTHLAVGTIAVGNDPQSALYDNLTGEVLVANELSGNVSVLNSTAVVSTVAVGSSPQVVYQDPVDGAIIVSNYGSGTSTFLNGTSYATAGNLSVTTQQGQVGYDPSTNHLAILDSSNDTLELNASNNTVVSSTSVTFWSRKLAVDPVTNEIYVSGGVNNTVTILSGSTGAAIATLPSAYTPTVALFDPLNGEVYISEEGGANISALNGATLAVADDILVGTSSSWDGSNPTNATVYLGGGCAGMNVESFNASAGRSTSCLSSAINAVAGVFDPVDNRLFLSNGYSQVDAVDLTTGVNTVFLNLSTSPAPPWPDGLAWSPVNDTLFVVNELWGNVTVYNASSGSLLASVGVGPYPGGATYDPYDGAVWVANSGGSSISEINVTNDSAVGTLSVGYAPQQLVLDPTTQQMFVTCQSSDEVEVLWATNGTAAKYLYVGFLSPAAGTIDLAGQLVFVANVGGSTVTVIDALGLTELATEATVAHPSALAYNAASGLLFASSSDLPSVSVIRPTLAAGPEIADFRSSPGTFVLGNTTQFTVTAARGNGSLSYKYTGLPRGCVSVNSSGWNCTPTAPGNFTVVVNVTDQSGNSANATTSLIVVDGLTIASLSASPAVVNVGTETNLSVNVSGAPAPFTFNWSGLPAGCPSVNASSWTCTPTAPGNFTVAVNVTDQFGHWTRASAPLSVIDSLTIGSLNATPTVLDVGMETNLTTVIIGDAPPFSFNWTGLPAGCLSQNTSSLPCRPTAPGAYSPTVRVEDAFGLVRTTDVGVTVQPALALTSLTSDFAAVDLGQSMEISASTSGGSAPITVQFTNLPPGCVAPAPSVFSFACQPNATGPFTVAVTVTDAVGATQGGSVTFRINTDPSLASVVATPSPTDEGAPFLVTSTVSGGTAPYAYAYTGLPGGCSSANLANLSCTPDVTGTFTVTATVTDAREFQATGTVTEVIGAAPPAPQVTNFLANPDPVALGNATMFTATVTGGTPTLGYAFSGLPPGCTTTDTPVLQCTPTAVGSFTVQFRVTDAAGRTAAGSTVLNVTAAPIHLPHGTTTLGSTGLPAYGWVVIVVVVAAVVVAGALLLRRRRSGTPESSAPDEAGEADPEEPVLTETLPEAAEAGSGESP